jgi:enolase
VHAHLSPALIGGEFESLEQVDGVLENLRDDHGNSLVGANTTAATSMAMLDLLARYRKIPRWAVLADAPESLPRPQIQILGGGAHAANRVAVQDFMVFPLSSTTLEDALEAAAEVYQAVGDVMRRKDAIAGVADEGGYWPEVSGTEEALDILVEGMLAAGLTPGADMGISLDIAASQFYREGRYHVGASAYTSDEWVDQLAHLSGAYPIVAIEDPTDEGDDEGMLRAVAQCSAVIVGDDYTVTNVNRINEVPEGALDAVLIKVNQVGTVSGAAQAVSASRNRELGIIVSARSGESEDTSVAHLATGWSADVVKVGSITRGERTAKWNELLRIDDELGGLQLAPPLRKTAPR